jgi:glycine/D-amino acid oxidase-like deaminating enzyme
MLDEARAAGLEMIVDEVTGIDVGDGAIQGVRLAGGESVRTEVVVNAAGPMAPTVAALADVRLPLFSELHLKVAYRDHLQVIPRDAPMFIWSDPQRIDWSEEEREELESQGRSDLLGEMPVFCHGRPEGGAESPYLLALWEYHGRVQDPVWPLPDDPLYPEVVMRGLTTMVPGLGGYLDRLPASVVDGGYYTKTSENLPLIGPAGPRGFYLACGFSGFGVMVACGGADLLARHITGSTLPDYSGSFLLRRYEDPGYVEAIAAGAASGQL